MSALPPDCGPRSPTARGWRGIVGQVERSREIIYDDVRPPGADVLDQRRELRAAARRRARRPTWWRSWPHAASSSAIAAASPDVRGACASPPGSWNTRGRASPRWRRFCAPSSNRSPDDRDADPAGADHRGPRPLRGRDGHPVPRSHARAVRPSWRLRPVGGRDRRPRRGPAPHRGGPRHRARRGGVEGARRPARHQPRRATSSCRWTRRSASPRSTWEAGRTPPWTSKLRVKRVGDLQAELLHDFFEGFAIGARANVHVKVLYGRSSHHHVEAVFKAFARALRVACSKDRQLARALPSTKGLI